MKMKTSLQLFWKYLRANELTLRAAALAYYAAFSIIPLLMLAFNALLWFLQDAQDSTAVIHMLIGQLPAPARPLALQFVEIAMAQSISNTLAILSLLWAASGFVSGLLAAVDRIHAASPRRHFLTIRLLSLALALLIPPAAYLYFLLTSLLRQLVHTLPMQTGISLLLDAQISRLLLALMLTGGFYLLYYLLPAQPIRRQSALLSAGFTTLAWLLVSALFGWYLKNSLPRLNFIYGSLATVIALFFYFYLSNLAILLGAQLNAILNEKAAA
jgi:membrane protein